MRRSKYVGFLVIALGLVLIIGAAVLPVSPATERFGPFRVDIRGDTCGPAGWVAAQNDVSDVCKEASHRRLLVATSIGLLVLALGMAMFAGPSERHGSRIEVPSVHARRRSVLHGPGSRR